MSPNPEGSTSGDEHDAPDPTPVTAIPIAHDFVDTIMERIVVSHEVLGDIWVHLWLKRGDKNDLETNSPRVTSQSDPAWSLLKTPNIKRFARQDVAQKAATKQIAAFAALLAPLAGAPDAPTTTIRRQLFNTDITADPANQGAPSSTLNPDAAPFTPANLDLQMIRELAALKQSLQDIHCITTSAPQIEQVLANTLRTPFSHIVTNVRLRPIEKLRLPTYEGLTDPMAHITSLNIAVRRANFSDEERDGGYCQLFVESLKGPVLTRFTGLTENSIKDFHDLSSAFFKNYIMFTQEDAMVSDLWNLSQGKDQSFEVSWRNSKPSSRNQNCNSHKTGAKNVDTRQEPRQHSSDDKATQKKNFLYVVDDETPPSSTTVVREKGWNVYNRETDGKPSESSAPASSRPPGAEKWCDYHNAKSHDTKECKTLFEQILFSVASGKLEIEPPKPRARSPASWSKNKDMKTQRSQGKAPKNERRATPEEVTPASPEKGNSSIYE
ncbi:uncharacterized protein LOC108808214 [Raphanus sativus]|uniref:Uncharacterized protein LOC108808214 n=1 Tax=Raphanus sativus TaxID=3726 RepID=A0A9W3BV38_RAPSA|nr:uncharacterized protein LOC108808214 [Raphanus sativus]